MKKLFTSQKSDTVYDTFIGKQYVVGDLTLVVEEVIAEGGFSYVFLVQDVAKHKEYALKRMLVNSQGDLDNCKREISIMKQFHRHPSIVPFKGHHTRHIGNGIYEVLMLMANCPNGTVVDKMNEHITEGFTEETIVEIFSGIVDAVALMHQNNICHRDLKVENILIGASNEYVLCDFGSAIKGNLDPEADGHTFVEENVNRFTTLQYRAPEMIDMYSGHSIGTPADCWALGVLLYKLCFFTTPFEDNTLAIARAKYNIPNEKYSDKILGIIKDTLRQHPEERLTANQITARLKDEVPAAAAVSSQERVTSAAVTSQTAGVSTKAAVTSPAGHVTCVSSHAESTSQPTTAPSAAHPRHVPDLPKLQAEDNTTVIKSRQRPRGHKHLPAEHGLIIAPPVLKPSSPGSSPRTKSPDPDHVTSAGHVTSADHVTGHVATPSNTAGQHIATPATDTQTKPNHVTTSLTDDTKVTEDPWGGAVPGASHSPHSPKPRHRQRPTPLSSGSLSSSALVLLPPPPSSPSHQATRRSRGHSRAKSDTTFLKTFNSSPTSNNPFMSDILVPQNMGQASLSSSTGHLQTTATPGYHGYQSPRDHGYQSPGYWGAGSADYRARRSPMSCSSETNFETAGWSSNPFNPSEDMPVYGSHVTCPEDEFLKLSLRDKGLDGDHSPTRQHQHSSEERTKKSTKVARAQTRQADPGTRAAAEPDPDRWSSNEPSSSLSSPVQLNSPTLSHEALLTSPPLRRVASMDTTSNMPKYGRQVSGGRAAGAHINHGLSLTSLSSDSTNMPIYGSQVTKKKKKVPALALFGKKKRAAAERRELQDGAVVSNPLHDNFNT